MAETASEVLTWPLAGMTCAACAASIERVLQRLPSVTASVNLAAERVQVEFDPQQVSAAVCLRSIRRAGFDVPLQQLSFVLPGLHDAAAAARLEAMLQPYPELQLSIQLGSGQVQIVYQPALTTLAEITNAIEQAGFQAVAEVGKSSMTPAPSRWSWLQNGMSATTKAVLCSLLSLPLVATMVGLPMSLACQIGFASVVQCWGGAGFYAAAWRALRGGHANMDVLVALGSTAAYAYSLYISVSEPTAEVYFDTSAVIISLVLWGRWIEARARHQTTAAVRQLAQLQPETARVERDGQVLLVEVAHVQLGEIVQVPAGAAIPVDGCVISGQSTVDESMLSGESLPLTKSVGSMVHAASLNGHGLLRVQVQARSTDSVLAKMIRRVEQAQGSKAPAQRLADRVAGIFVPAVLLIALLTLVLTWWLTTDTHAAWMHAVAVLVIACPCALGLATPAAIMVGTGLAARYGILVRDAAALEQLSQLATVVFDKTGTLTHGRPQLRACYCAPDVTSVAALRWAALIEQASNHPLAQAFIDAAQAQGLVWSPVTQLDTEAGAGLVARTAEGVFRIGRLDWVLQGQSAPLWLKSSGIETSSCVQVGLSCDQRLLAVFELADSVRADAASTVAYLQAEGIPSWLLSGDRYTATAAVAKAVGIEHFRAEVRPAAKADNLLALRQARSGVLAMVGDGINDAAALAEADIGIAMGRGAMVAIEAASVVLLQDRLQPLLMALTISRATRRVIRQNLGFAFGYNLIGIPLAALGWLNPMLASAMMALSSVSVLTNALRLARYDPAQRLQSDLKELPNDAS